MKSLSFQKLLAELLGTFMLATVVLVSLTPSTPFPLATPIAAALSLGLSVYLLGSVSGCHINPAISLAMLVCRQMDIIHFVGYIIFQCAGALLAYFFSAFLYP
ncbi:aquaporin [Shewanella surugensis]|uniref:Aquaporin n=1 Tax=Shewanella surugensis TaxID=212020 RepID=A0ABT0LGJ7_9GAMM|nr:aquaporin [Shewanella surugensis]MCL1126814.1 aquaporin [Shewanella surugensis]